MIAGVGSPLWREFGTYDIILVALLIFVATNMPSTINLYQIGVWFCVGFFTGAGWAIAAWLVGRIFSHV
jgi:hypothetical protein